MENGEIKYPKPNYIVSVLDNRCPRCRTGKIYVSQQPYDFKHTMKMHESCPACGQPTEIEVGFYYGTGYVSYALTVGFSVATLILWWLIIGFSLKDNRFFVWMAVNAALMIILQPIFMRLSRTLWLSWFVGYDPDWRKKKPEHFERVIPEQMKNW